ncbi:tripartite motif-containing protein 14-like [Rana temporaria]|uniref:tripartite motif-containing protein 14-like n=1 Tax=Rana temporaria TaxID=8407 RepID=UPI001AAD19AB|nr:tripartite motif-containing protein 14-like [Rana temporaria]
MKLRNIAETFLSPQPDQEESGVLCTYCVDSPVPAVRSCLHCEVSLCDKHLRVHKKSPEHILCDPTLSMESRKCSIHKEVLNLCDTEDGDNEDRERHEELLHDGGGLGVAGVLHTGLSDIITEVNIYFYIQGAADILLDGNTAYYYLQISDDRKTVSKSHRKQNHPETPERFQGYYQVMSSQSFSSGRHYWEVDVGGSESWTVGMCYPSIERRGWESLIGDNKKSWGLYRNVNDDDYDGGNDDNDDDDDDDQYYVIHDGNKIPLSTNPSSNRVRIDLDYEAGRISFYDLCDPIRHLHTFTTTFTEPLHAGIGVWDGCIKICGGRGEM